MAPGADTTTLGGGADTFALATWNGVGGRATAITVGPDVSRGVGATATMGVTSVS